MMARQWPKFEADVRRLISSITGFEEYEENFGLCLQFAQSNITHHQFLSVDSHKARRTLNGLEEKFAIHSDEKKTRCFKDLTTTFLESPVFEDRDKGKTDTHYAILSLLAHLAVAPTHAPYRPLKKSRRQEEADDFDWKAYLLDGEDVFSGPYPPTPEWSEDSDSDSDSAYPAPARRAVRFPAPRVQSPGPDPAPPARLPDGGGVHAHDEWLTRNVITQYWTAQHAAHIDVTHSRETSLASDWDDYLLSQNQLYVPGESTMLTEYQVIREVLWMVSGMEKTFIFEVNNGSYTVRPGVAMAHLSKEALHHLLTEVTEYGNIVLRLNVFIDDVKSSLCSHDQHGRPDMRTCQTYQAFVRMLSKVIKEFRSEVMLLEKDVALQEKHTSLLRVMEQLRRWSPQLHLLNKVYEEGVVAVFEKTNVERATHLLSVLYTTLVDLDTLGQDTLLVVLFLRLWSATSRPYWDIVDRWISQGELSDPYREFLIQRNENVNSLDEDFWNTVFTLHAPGMGGSENTSRQGAPPPTSGKDGGVAGCSDDPPAAPEFLQPVLRQVILAGKSMEMLQALGRLSDIVDDHQSKGGARDTLYESFIKSLQKHTGTKSKQPETGEENVDEAPDRDEPGDIDQRLTGQMLDQINVKGVYDPLLRHNFSRIFDKSVFRHKSLMDKEDKLEQLLCSLDISHVMPIPLLLEKCLYPDIRQRYQRVCRHLLDVLKTEYHLLDYFAAMRAFFLMEAGDTMYDFYTELFDKLRLQESWHDMAFLNLSLKEALAPHFPEHADRLFVSVANLMGSDDVSDDVMRRTRDRQPINALDDLKMHYKTPWPINVVLNTHSFKVYHSVFSFLLQIKRSKYSLDQLRFYDLVRTRDFGTPPVDRFPAPARQVAARADRVHRMHLFRMKLMHFLNSLHNYIMTRILHSTGLEFQQALSNTEDLDDVILLHNTYVGHLHERCLLHHKVRILKDAVTKVMNLALALQACWDEGVDSVSEKHLAGMETVFSRCIHFLGSFLNNVVKRGTHPHLGPLAYALLTSSEHGKTQDVKPS